MYNFASGSRRSVNTRAMCDHPALFDFLPALLQQSQQCVECTPRFEGADSLKVLAFEEESKLWASGSLTFKRRSNQGFDGLRC